MRKEKRNIAIGPQVQSQSGKQKPNKKKKGIVSFLAVSSIGIGIQTATQYFSYKLNYQPVLGWNYNHFYPTWDIFRWWLQWKDVPNLQSLFNQTSLYGFTACSLGMVGAAIVNIFSGRSPHANEFLHGSARWAGKSDIEKSGLLSAGTDGDAVYVGGWMDRGKFRYLRHSGPEHVLTFAPTRSGKGVGLVIPTLLSWTQSAVIADLKGELKALTSGWRQKYAKNKVIFWEPAASGSARWNPLHEVRVGTEYETADIQNLAQLIVDPDGKGLNSHWDKTAFSTMCGLIAHAIYQERAGGNTATLSEVDRLIADPDNPGLIVWQNMQEATYWTDPEETDLTKAGGPHPLALRAARDIIETPEEERGSIISTTKSYLSLYRDPRVQKNTECCDYRISDLMNNADPVSLYVITQPADKTRLKPLVKLKFNMIVRLLTAKMEFEGGRSKKLYKHRLLMMLDEFPSLGKMDILQESLAFMAGYGIKAYLITQDLNQLTSRENGYGPDESISSNCHVQNAYPPNRQMTADYISKLCGTTTIVKESITESGKRSSAIFGQVSRTLTETARPLLTPDESMRMPGPKKDAAGQIVEPGDMVISVAGFPAIYGKQPLFFLDPTFKARASIDAPDKSDILCEPSSLKIKQRFSIPDGEEK